MLPRRTKFVLCTLVVILSLATVNGQQIPRRGQYNLNVKQLLVTNSPDDFRDRVKAIASGTLFEYAVDDIFGLSEEQNEKSLVGQPTLPPVSPQCLDDFNQMLLDIAAGEIYALTSKFNH